VVQRIIIARYEVRMEDQSQDLVTFAINKEKGMLNNAAKAKMPAKPTFIFSSIEYRRSLMLALMWSLKSLLLLESL
jgi:hypothetical protein